MHTPGTVCACELQQLPMIDVLSLHALLPACPTSLKPSPACPLSQAQVHTPGTVRARELQQLHRGLALPHLGVDERLDLLLHVKWTVKEFDCGLTREIVQLIDREADLLNRWVGWHALV